jgi:DnaJ-class molecular chaperone
MTNTTASARILDLFPGVAAAATKLAAHREAKPLHADNDPGWKAWVARSIELQAEYREAWKATKGIVCQKCGGSGRYEVYTRVNRCERCGGDGWTAKGRKLRDAK